jgi:hypothetical protein
MVGPVDRRWSTHSADIYYLQSPCKNIAIMRSNLGDDDVIAFPQISERNSDVLEYPKLTHPIHDIAKSFTLICILQG